MAVSLEQFKRGEFGEGDPFIPNLPPMNQVFAKAVGEHQEKGRDRRAEKAKARREKWRLGREESQFQKA